MDMRFSVFAWIVLAFLVFELICRVFFVYRENYPVQNQQYYIAKNSQELFEKKVYDNYIVNPLERESFYRDLQSAHREIGTKINVGKIFKSEFINFRDDERITLPNLAIKENDLLLFGGSTVLCLEVPDHLTLPSQIQKFFAQLGMKMQVHNFGRGGKKIKKIEGDIDSAIIKYPFTKNIVCLFGFNDIGWQRGRIPANFFSAVIDLFLKIFSVLLTARLVLLFIQASRVRINSKNYARANIKFFRHLREKYLTIGIDSYFVLQPVLHTKEHLSSGEKSWLNSDPLFAVGIQSAYGTYISEGLGIVEPLVGIFNNYRGTIFVDDCHLGPLGNQILGQEIANLVAGRPKASQKVNDDFVKSSRSILFAAVRRGSRRRVEQNPYMYPLF